MRMTRRRWILLGLLVMAVGLSVVYLVKPNDGLEILCLVFAVPVVTVNMWEWDVPEIMENYFGE
jgi:hypothetical protein